MLRRPANSWTCRGLRLMAWRMPRWPRRSGDQEFSMLFVSAMPRTHSLAECPWPTAPQDVAVCVIAVCERLSIRSGRVG